MQGTPRQHQIVISVILSSKAFNEFGGRPRDNVTSAVVLLGAIVMFALALIHKHFGQGIATRLQ